MLLNVFIRCCDEKERRSHLQADGPACRRRAAGEKHGAQKVASGGRIGFSAWLFLLLIMAPRVFSGENSPPREPLERVFVCPSKALGANMPVRVLLPAREPQATKWPAIYALHGAGGDERSWPSLPALREAVVRENVVVVSPTAGAFSWYVDSWEKKNSNAATFIAQELPAFLEGRLPLRAERGARGAMGMSMGGHGALYLAAKYPDVFISASSLSGVLDLTRHPNDWRLPEVLGPFARHKQRWVECSALYFVEALKRGDIRTAVDCGRDDFAFEENEAFAAAAEKIGLRVDYRTFPGGHDAMYWNRHVGRHVAFHAAAFRVADAASANPLAADLEAVLNAPEREFALEKGALLLSREEFPEADLPAAQMRIKELSDRLAGALNRADSASAKLAALRTLLFETEKFRLPEKDDARAFLLTEVLRERCGNCLGLSVLCLVLAERAGLPLIGVAVPARGGDAGHLLVRLRGAAEAAENPTYFDPAEGGTTRTEEYYRDLFKPAEAQIKAGDFLATAGTREVLTLLLENLGGERVVAGRAAAALPLMERARSLRPDHPPLLNNLGAAQLETDDVAGALETYAAALRVWPDYVPAKLGRAQALLRQKQTAEAEKDVRAVMAADPKNMTARLLLASVHLSRHEHKAAQGVMRDALLEQPQNIELHRGLATACRAAGDLTAAEESFRAVLMLAPDDVRARNGLADVLRDLGRMKEANAERDKVRELGAGNAVLAEAEAAARESRWADAERAALAALKDEPKNVPAWRILVSALIAQRKLADAEGRLNRAVAENPQAHELYGLLGEVRLRRDDAAGAHKAFDRAANLTDAAGRKPYVRRIAFCYLRLGYNDEALKLAQKLLVVDADDADALRVAAAAAAKLRRTAEAKSLYERILKSVPEDEEAMRGLKSLK